MAEHYIYKMSFEFGLDPVAAMQLAFVRDQGLRDRAARKRLDRSCRLMYRFPARQKWTTRAERLLSLWR